MKKTVILLLLAIGVLAGTLMFRSKKERSDQATQKDRLLFSGSFEELSKFGWINPPDKIEFEKINNRWWITQPFSALADTNEIFNVFQSTLARPSEQNFENSDELKDFRFSDSPQLLYYRATQGEGQFKVGLKRGYGDTIYLMDQKSTVYVMPFDWKSSWEKKAEEFVEKQIVPFPKEEWSQIEVHTQRNDFVLQKSGDRWNLVSPKNCLLNAVGEKWITELENLRSIKIKFAGAQLAPGQISEIEKHKMMTVELTSSGKLWGIVLGFEKQSNPAQEGYAWSRSQSVIHQVFSHSIDQLNLDPRQFCDIEKSK